MSILDIPVSWTEYKPASISKEQIQLAMWLRQDLSCGMPEKSDPHYKVKKANILKAKTILKKGKLHVGIPSLCDDPVETLSDDYIENLSWCEKQNIILMSKLERSVQVDLNRVWNMTTPTRSDSEHAHEDARKIIIAYETGLPFFVFTSTFFNDVYRADYLSLHTKKTLNSDRATNWMGVSSPPWWLNAFPNSEQLRLARRYWEIPIVMKMSHRVMLSVATLPHCVHALRAMRREGFTQAFVKASRLKVGTWLVDLPAEARTLEGAFKCLMKAVGTDILRLPDTGSEKGFLVQSVVPMQNETRCFVIDNKIVAMVPVRRDDTVYDATRKHCNRIEPRLCLTPSGSPSVENRKATAQRAWFARKAIAGIKKESAKLTDYVIDIAENQLTGELLVIELNPLSNAGIYSCDPEYILKAQLKSYWTSRPASRYESEYEIKMLTRSLPGEDSDVD